MAVVIDSKNEHLLHHWKKILFILSYLAVDAIFLFVIYQSLKDELSYSSNWAAIRKSAVLIIIIMQGGQHGLRSGCI